MNLTKFFKLSRRTSFSFNTDLGFLKPLDTKDCAIILDQISEKVSKLCVPRGQRFFVGGEYSIRGFEFGTIGPKETYLGTQTVAGGYQQVIFNTEYVFKVNDPMRLVWFADGGYAYGYRETVDLSKLRYSTGMELRLFLPVFQFPIRFIYAINPRSKPGDKFQGFQFTVGNTY